MKRLIFCIIVFLLLAPAIYAANKCPKNAPCLIDTRTFSIYVTYDKDIRTMNSVKFYNNATKQQVAINYSQINSTTFKFGPVTVPQFDLYILNTTVTSTDGVASNESSYFLVKLLPLKISLVVPPFGVASELLINLTVKTDRHSNCKYDFEARTDFSNVRYSFSRTYTSGNTGYYIAENFGLSPNAAIPIFVMCYDSEFEKYVNKTFLLSYDGTEPVILSAEARPSLVTEKFADRLYETTFVVNTDDETVCRYDISSKPYDRMLFMFEGEDETNGASYNFSHNTVISVASEGHYEYYVACRNLAGLFSEVKKISFIVNASLPLQIIYISPEPNSIIAASKSPLMVITNKDSTCQYGTEFPSAATGTFSTRQTRHVSNNLTLQQGSNTYYFKCDFLGQRGSESTQASTTFIVDTSAPSRPVVAIFAAENSSLQGKTYLTDRFMANWTSSDNETGIVQYRYKIQSADGNTSTDWMPYFSTESKVSTIISGLSLETKKSYKLIVDAQNGAGLWSSNGTSNPLLIDERATPGLCSNGQLDPSTETDTDCGLQCPACPDNSKCKLNSDCISRYCNATSRCQKATCYDKIKNGNETGTDCGGNCLSCYDGGDTGCFDDTDCAYPKICKAGSCVEEKCSNGVKDISEADVDCGSTCGVLCEEGKHCYDNTDCKSGITCDNNICGGTTPIATECTTDSDCDTGYICENDVCVEEEPDVNIKECIIDEDCQEGYKCEDNVCVEKGGFSFWSFLLWLFIIVLLAVGVFIVFSAMRKKPVPKQSSPFPPAGAEFGPMQKRPMGPMTTRQAPPGLVQKRRQQFKDEHKKVFDEFGEAGEEITPESKPEIKPSAEAKTIEVPQAPKEKPEEKVSEAKEEKPEEKPTDASFKDIHEELVQKLEKMSKTKYKKAKPTKTTKKKK